MNNLEEQIAEAEKIRLLEIEAFGLANVDNKYTFYYDETNNIRKLSITDEKKLNVKELKSFVLGGVLIQEELAKPNIELLREKIKLPTNATEIKLKHLAQGDFLELISSWKLTHYLKWLEESNLLVHYRHIDLMYWSIVDIIDSIIEGVPELQNLHANFKADLYEVVKCHRDLIITIFCKYQYPNVASSHGPNFLKEIMTLIEQNQAQLHHFNYYMLKGLFQKALKLKELPFIEGNRAHKLIENFYAFYFTRVIMFKNSQHLFDEEQQIQEHFNQDEVVSTARKGQFQFIRSENESLIQVSDIFVGIMGKFHSYITATSLSEIQNSCRTLDENSNNNLRLLNTILTKSEDTSKAFIHHIASQYDINKSAIIFNK